MSHPAIPNRPEAVVEQSAATCPNCGTKPTSDVGTRYCACCGQDNARARLETKGVLLDTLQNLLGWDNALVRTLRGLALHPATLAGAFVDGRRRSFVNPARFCLLSLALWFLAMHLASLDPMRNIGITITSSGDGDEVADRLRHFLGRNLELLQFLSLPLLALSLRWLFRRSGRNLAECLVLVLYVVGFRYLVAALFVPLELLVEGSQNVVRIIFGPVWLAWAARGFFGASRWSTIWRVAVAVILHLFATILLFTVVALPFVLWTAGEAG